MEFLLKHFVENRKEKLSPNDSSSLSNLKNAKTNTISWQTKFHTFFQSYLLATSNVPHFSTKKKSVIILKMKERFGHFSWRFTVLVIHLFLIFVDKAIFFFKNIQSKNSSSNFYTDLCYMQANKTYITLTKEL